MNQLRTSRSLKTARWETRRRAEMVGILPTIIDISSWQGGIAWATVKGNVLFAIIRAQDGTYLDPRLAENIAGCGSNGIPYYVYGFYRNGGATEAARMVSRAKQAGAKRVRGYVLDVEVSGQSTAGIKSAMSTLNASGLDNGLYIANHLYAEYGGVDYGEKWLWIPTYGRNDGMAHNPPNHYCDLWQFTSKGRVHGIDGDVDCNALAGKRTLESFIGDVKVPEKPSEMADLSLSAEVLVGNVFADMYGSGEERRKNLGARYDEIQALVTHVCTAPVSELVREVWAGKWGNGEVRRRALANRYDEVMEAINGAESASRVHIVARGDTLSAIAAKYGTTVSAIMARNPHVKNPNIIYVGQAITV